MLAQHVVLGLGPKGAALSTVEPSGANAVRLDGLAVAVAVAESRNVSDVARA